MPSWSVLQSLGAPGWVFLALLGAVAGSFASVAVYRVPRAWFGLDQPPLSLTRPARSFCPRCRHTIRWHDNLPVLGWLLRGGRCRDCGARYGAGYLLHELVLAAGFALAGSAWPGHESWLALLWTCGALTGMWIGAAIDWRWKLLPDAVTLWGIPYGLLGAVLAPRFQLWEPGRTRAPFPIAGLGLDPQASPALTALASSAAAALLCGASFWGLRRLFSALLRAEALGEGDVLYFAAVGALLGLEGAAWTLLVSVVLGSAMGIWSIAASVARVARHRRRRGAPGGWRENLALGWRLGREIPYGPALVAGTALVLLYPLAVRQFFLETWPGFLQSFLH